MEADGGLTSTLFPLFPTDLLNNLSLSWEGLGSNRVGIVNNPLSGGQAVVLPYLLASPGGQTCPSPTGRSPTDELVRGSAVVIETSEKPRRLRGWAGARI